jgi:hypothetical protein
MSARRISAIGAIGLLMGVATVAGCSAPSNPDQAAPASDQPASSVVGESSDRDVVMFMNSEASLKEDYATIEELARSKTVVAIVRGTVSAVRDVYVERSAFRVLSVNVAEGLLGQAGRQISVVEEGGVVPYAKVAPDFPRKDGDPAPPANPAGYVDFRFMGARHSEVGDEVVLFLGANPNIGTPIETEYNMVSSVRGRFTLDVKTNQIVRSLGSPDRDFRPGYLRTVDVRTLRSEVAAATR